MSSFSLTKFNAEIRGRKIGKGLRLVRVRARLKAKDDGLTPEQRRERDAKALQEKAAKKAAQEAGGSKAGSKDKK